MLRILIASDDAEDSAVLMKALTNAGHSAVHVKNEDEFDEEMRSFDPQIFLIDCDAAGTDAIRALTHGKEKQGSGIHVMAACSARMPGIRHRAHYEGVDVEIHSPFSDQKNLSGILHFILRIERTLDTPAS